MGFEAYSIGHHYVEVTDSLIVQNLSKNRSKLVLCLSATPQLEFL